MTRMEEVKIKKNERDKGRNIKSKDIDRSKNKENK